jgi:hypothetical protein
MVDFMVLLFLGVIVYLVASNPGGARAVNNLNKGAQYYMGVLTGG